ncbi:Plasmodium exported protein, unknown function [Plasmodium malariae]|uniref:Variable surface protein n=1 Tax=Plasmodium malariae TaxID=5858 RepID=A0A1D3PB27_PLAMA|nr:Plasmodium exported protein, unknown function [Plasmodium malariae]SCN12475.1 Plasmodium exported protein, unknown function [Plasmodium malariae]
MEKYIKLLLFIKIATFFFLQWTCHFYINVSKFNKSFVYFCEIGRQLDTRSYRLLAKYREKYASDDVWLKEKMLYNEGCTKKDLSNNEKLTKYKNKQANRISLDNSRNCEHPGKIKKFVYERGDSHLEEGISRKLEYENEFRKVAKDDFKILKKRVNKTNFFLYLLPVLLLIIGITYFTLEQLNVIKNQIPTVWSHLSTVDIVLPLALSLIILPAFFYVLTKTVNYNKFIYVKSRLKCMNYPTFPRIVYNTSYDL